MSERMKKDKVIAILQALKINILNDNFGEELLEALDIAIDSLDNEWQTDKPKESGYYLVTNGANKVDIRKYDNGWYYDMYRRYTNEELEIVAWKKFEPYERKESE